MRTEPPTGDELTQMLVTMKRNVLDEASRDPAPARRRARNRAIITSTAILLTLGLGAGAAIAAGVIGEDEEPGTEVQPTATLAATPAPAPTPTPFGIETAPPVDPLSTVTEIVVRPEHLDLRDAGGALVVALSYDADATEFVGTLGTVLAAPPEQAEVGGSMETKPATEYRWDGLSVFDDHEGYGIQDVDYARVADMNVHVRVTAPVLGDGVAVRTADGFQAGDDIESLAAELGQRRTFGDWYHFPVETGDLLGDRQPGFDVDNAFSVGVTDSNWNDTARSTIFAPYNFGIPHA